MKLQSIRTSENFEILVELDIGITGNLSDSTDKVAFYLPEPYI